MTEIEIPQIPLIKPKVIIDKVTKYKLWNSVSEESQVIIHCSYTGSFWNDRIRIWKSTFLYAKGSNHRSKLVHTENITHFTIWMPVNRGETIIFTLIFTGLPKHCKQFDLIENIPETGGFIIKNIERNRTDIYFLDVRIAI